MHITFIIHEGERKYFVEKYNSELEMVEYGPIVNLNSHSQRPSGFMLYGQWINNEGQLYIYDFRNLDEEGHQIRRGYIKEVKE